MRSFEVLECPQVMTESRVKKVMDESGVVNSYTEYHVVKAGEKRWSGERWYPGAYGVTPIKVGDVIKLNGHFADKAANNPAFKEVEAVVKKKVSKKAKKKASKK